MNLNAERSTLNYSTSNSDKPLRKLRLKAALFSVRC
jgi:hypothetical protein